MSAHVVITLDTEAPELLAEVTQDAGDPTLATIALSSPDLDVDEVLLWGDIDVTDPLNSSYGEAEGEAEWLPWASSLQVRLRPDATVLRVRARDDVWNETDVVVLSVTTVTPPPPAPTPARPRGGVPAKPARQPDRVVSFPPSVLEVSTQYSVRSTNRSDVVVAFREDAVLHVSAQSRVPVGVELATAVTASLRSENPSLGLEESAIVRKQDIGPDEGAALAALDIL